MPVHRIGMRLEPDGFFDRNPSPGLPTPSRHCAPPESVTDSCCH
ncbi:hypothetical protein GCM10022221_77710 [Actinocorallia aurea]